MTFSNKFTALDNREAALLDELCPEQRAAFEQICAAYESEFRPENDMERDTAYCLATLRWGIDRIRGLEDNLQAVFAGHTYMPPKFRLGLEELNGYQRELQTRYEHYFTQLLRLQGFRQDQAA